MRSDAWTDSPKGLAKSYFGRLAALQQRWRENTSKVSSATTEGGSAAQPRQLCYRARSRAAAGVGTGYTGRRGSGAGGCWSWKPSGHADKLSPGCHSPGRACELRAQKASRPHIHAQKAASTYTIFIFSVPAVA
eukprot:1899520-Pleurochrysis_carterae.AAC.5